jgi:subtilase-type serine protease
MNRVFKTKWSVAHQEYVVTDEKHTTKTKAAKSAVALAVAALMLGAGAASAAYVEKGFVAQNSEQFNEAVASWESEEYKSDWGLTAMNASTAYGLGFRGQGVKVAVMDSGALLQKHSDLAGDRFTGTHVTGQYGSSGNRYPQSVWNGGEGQPYEKGEAFDVTGEWMQGVNDSHGTHVTGTVGGNRDGNVFHGVAWESDIVVGNTGATDSNNYGPFQDYDFFYAGWKALADDLNASNGAERGGVINNSWGTNIRIMALQQLVKNDKGELVWKTVTKDGQSIIQKPGQALPDGDNDPEKEGAYRWAPVEHIPTNSVQQAEYEYFLSNKMYAGKYEGTDHEGKSFVDAAWDAVKGTKVVQIFTTGNRNSANPFYRPLYPYFNPEAEQNWIAVGGLTQAGTTADGKQKYKLWDTVNEAGLGKWWTVVAPGTNISSSIVNNDGTPGYSNTYSGTSMAAPHVAGAMGVLMSRYQDMDAIQVRDVMFTTATHKNPDGSIMEGWNNADGSEVLDGQVSDRMGWGMPDLNKGMYGPGQFLGKFDYNMANTPLDVWTNDVTQVALDQRYAEDMKWKADYEKNLAADDFVLGEDWVLGNGTDDEYDHFVDKEDAKEWRKAYYEKRLAAIEAKIKNGEYDGSLVKRGEGTLVMTGNNTYRGGTTVEGGTLLGFAESFGVTGDNAKATANGKVTVNGGTFGLLATYNDQFTMKGDEPKHNEAAGHSVDVVVNAGGTFQITAGQDVTMGKLEFKEGAGFTVGSEDVDVLKEAYAGKAQTGTVTTTGVTGADLAVANPDYAFFKTELKAEGNKLTGTLSRDETKSFATYAQNANGLAIAGALEGAAGGALYDALIGASKGDVSKTYNSLGDDFILNTRNAGIVNGMTLSRAIKDQATGIGEGRKVEMADGTARLWATGVGSWSTLDYGQSDMDSDFYAGLFGAEVDVCAATKLGLFFGAGSTDNKAGSNKVESDDIHFGAYGVTNFSDVVNATYGFVYSHQSADATRALQVGSQLGMNAFSGDTDITQIFAEAAYTGLNTDAYSIEPYFALSWIHAESDGFNEQVGAMAFSTTTEDQDVQVTTLGVRGAIPFTMGATKVALKGDVAWNHFFGDTEAEASMNLAGSGVAHLKGGELADMASVGLGVEAQVGKMTTMGLSYTGAYDGDITSHGISANVRFNF